jgi:TRAP-type C4-dicarboxylate transport system permease small subunit
MARDRTRETPMLATWQTFMNSVINHFPEKARHPVEILIYFAILGVMAVVPLILWLGWAVSTTDFDEQS